MKTHVRNAMDKLEANTRVHAIAIALREGFISAARAEDRSYAPRRDDRRRLRHDLRTPLTIVAGFAEVLAGDSAISDATAASTRRASRNGGDAATSTRARRRRRLAAAVNCDRAGELDRERADASSLSLTAGRLLPEGAG